MLLHTPAKGNIICLSESPKWMKQKNRILITHFKKPSPCVSHQKSMTIVNWIPELESKDGISIPFGEFRPKFWRGKSVFVKTIVVFDWLYDFKITTNQPISCTCYGFFNIWETRGSGSPCSCYSFFFVVLVDLNTIWLIHKSSESWYL